MELSEELWHTHNPNIPKFTHAIKNKAENISATYGKHTDLISGWGSCSMPSSVMIRIDQERVLQGLSAEAIWVVVELGSVELLQLLALETLMRWLQLQPAADTTK